MTKKYILELSSEKRNEICQPIPAKQGKTERYDYEYERNGVSN
jgi:hypothetical protein